jgi:hypothetical protein
MDLKICAQCGREYPPRRDPKPAGHRDLIGLIQREAIANLFDQGRRIPADGAGLGKQVKPVPLVTPKRSGDSERFPARP